MLKLYRKNANSIGTWRIWAEGAIIYIAHATVQGGSEVNHTEEVSTNLSGRSLEEQVALRIRSRVSRMLDRGYKATQAEAAMSSSNQMGLDRPMLAQPIKRAKHILYKGAVLQKKLDGHRCLITCQDGEIIAYTRQGKPIPSIKHILNALYHRIPEGTTLDGELYCHGVKLQTIGSWIKREQPATENLFFVCYDMLSKDAYKDRHEELSSIIKDASPKVIALPYRDWTDHESTTQYFKETRASGFEGLMLRLDGYPYESGKRSYGLLKIKEFEQSEFKVIGFEASSTGWAICNCITEHGVRFDCSAPGSVSEKTYVLEHQAEFQGRMLTVDFAHWTDDGVPFQPTAIRWREDI
jgi:DNA ligase-1